MRVLVANPGSSSLKLSLLDGDTVVADTRTAADAAASDAVAAVLARSGGADAAGVRVVHGGERYTRSVVVDDGVVHDLDALRDLAPLHNPPALALLRAIREQQPALPLVACFDTAFHATLPPEAFSYAVPRQWRREWGLRRYGFHGLSHAYASRRAAALLEVPLPSLRLVSCHLGAGASLAAIRGGVSVDTTMGYTPLDGLVMATRSGSIDPGVLLAAMRRHRLSTADLETVLDRESGLLGLCGRSDMREVLSAAQQDDGEAGAALAVYVHRLRAAIAAMAAAMEGLEALVFTGGIGEHAPEVRAAATEGLAFLGVEVDSDRNAAVTSDGEVTATGASVRTLVITAREDLEIAREVRQLLRVDA